MYPRSNILGWSVVSGVICEAPSASIRNNMSERRYNPNSCFSNSLRGPGPHASLYIFDTSGYSMSTQVVRLSAWYAELGVSMIRFEES